MPDNSQTRQSNKHHTDYDVVIVGGGLIGASLACALADQPLRIAVIEAIPFGAVSQPSFDDRSIALSLSSKRIFDAVGVWADIKNQATAIRHIHVSDRGRFGMTRLDSESQGVEALGYVVVSKILGAAFAKRLPAVSNVDLICPAQLKSVEIKQDEALLTVEHKDQLQNISARLIVAADGRESLVRQTLAIKATDLDYKQTAIIANIKTQKSHNNVAYERFTSSGPIAVLPLTDDRSAIVWTCDNEQVETVMALDDDAFLGAFQQKFGYRLGRLLKVGARHSYPLRLVHSKEQVRHRLALIGNAAHSLHPIAGQGFNLGLRDVATLAEILQHACAEKTDIGQLQLLQRYAGWRKRDHDRVVTFTDGLVRLFSNDFLPLSVSRNLGLLATDLVPPVKRLITKQAMGLSGKLPRLARGLGL